MPPAKLLSLLAIAALAALATSCAPSTPQSRIAANPSLYEALPAKHQELASQGRVTKGMSKEAVFLAWGRPARKGEGSRNGRSFERWDYARYRAVHYNRFYGFSGYGWCGRHYGYGWVPAVDFVPYRSGTILFHDSRVDSWERVGPYR